jgi:small subunit ribosomal protein S20
MAKSLSPAKRRRASISRRARNQPIRSAARTNVSKARMAIGAGVAEEAAEALREAVAVLDRAAQKGVIHPNNEARRKSRLMKEYSAAFAPKPAEAEEAKEEEPKRRRRAAPKAETAKKKSTRTTKTTARTRTTKTTARTRTTKGTTRSPKGTKGTKGAKST